MEALLEELLEQCRPYTRQGKVATYIPELAKANLDDLGIYVLRSDTFMPETGTSPLPSRVSSSPSCCCWP